MDKKALHIFCQTDTFHKKHDGCLLRNLPCQKLVERGKEKVNFLYVHLEVTIS